MKTLIQMYDGCDYSAMLEHAAESVRQWPDFFRLAVSRDLGTDGTISWAKGLPPSDALADSIRAILTKLAYTASSRSGIAHADGLKHIAQSVGRCFPVAVAKCTAINTTQTPKTGADGETVITDTRTEGEKVRTVGFRFAMKGEKDHILDATTELVQVSIPLEHAEPSVAAPSERLPDPFTDHDRAIWLEGETSGYAHGLATGKAQVRKVQADKAQVQAHALVRESVLAMLAMLAMMPDTIGNHAWACTTDERPAIRKAQVRKVQAR